MQSGLKKVQMRMIIGGAMPCYKRNTENSAENSRLNIKNKYFATATHPEDQKSMKKFFLKAVSGQTLLS